MLSVDDNRNSQKQSVDLISKITSLHMQHTFFVHFFAVVLHDYNEKLPETSWLYVLCALVHFFFGCHSFSPWWPLASPFSHRCYKIFMFLSNEIGLLCFLSRALAFSLLSMSMQTLKLSGKKESALLLLFLSLNVREAMRFNAKTRVCLKCKISSPLA